MSEVDDNLRRVFAKLVNKEANNSAAQKVIEAGRVREVYQGRDFNVAASTNDLPGRVMFGMPKKLMTGAQATSILIFVDRILKDKK